jgi:hypothetical protein
MLAESRVQRGGTIEQRKRILRAIIMQKIRGKIEPCGARIRVTVEKRA